MADEIKDFHFPVRLERCTSPPPPDRPLVGFPLPLGPQLQTDIWAPGTKEPFVAHGLIGIRDAFEEVGKARFGSEWLGHEGAYRGNLPPFPRPSVVFDGDTDVVADVEAYRRGREHVLALLGHPTDRTSTLSNSEWCEATDRWQLFETYGPNLIRRREATIDLIHRALADGELVAVICRADGELIRVKKTAWNCDRSIVWKRLKCGSLADVDGTPAAAFCPPITFFFDGKTLKNFSAALAEASDTETGKKSKKPAEKSELPYNPSSKWEEIEEWYKERVAGAPEAGYTRDEDILAGHAVGISRDRVRDLRREHKPEHWSKGGRPRGKTRRGK